MSLKVYVGNYPSNFSRRDVENLFRDFGGMKLDQFKTGDTKCFSFFSCNDFDQLVSVIKIKNDTKVKGRRLKVRACDHKLQEYVDLLLKEEDEEGVAQCQVSSDDGSHGDSESNRRVNSEVHDHNNIKTNNFVNSKSNCPDSFDADSISKSVFQYEKGYKHKKSPPLVPLKAMKNECANQQFSSVAQDHDNTKSYNHVNSKANYHDKSDAHFSPNSDSKHNESYAHTKSPLLVELQAMRNKHANQQVNSTARDHNNTKTNQQLNSKTNYLANSDAHSSAYCDSQCSEGYAHRKSPPLVSLQALRNERANQRVNSTTQDHDKTMTDNHVNSKANYHDNSDAHSSTYLNSRHNDGHVHVKRSSYQFVSSKAQAHSDTKTDFHIYSEAYHDDNSDAHTKSPNLVSLQAMRKERANQLFNSTAQDYNKTTTDSHVSSKANYQDNSDAHSSTYCDSQYDDGQVHFKRPSNHCVSSKAHHGDNSDAHTKSPPLVPLQVMRNEHACNLSPGSCIVVKLESSPNKSFCSNEDDCESYATDFSTNLSDTASVRSQCTEYSYDSYATGSTIQSDNASVRSQCTERSRSPYDYTWVSFTNFPLYTSVREIYELFGDYSPIKVKIICNERRRGRPLTEAHVCFPNREIAEEVMLTFDNTVFNGRIVLVTDIDDLTILDDLLEVFH